MKKTLEYLLKQSLFLNLLTLFIFLAGTIALFTIQREAFPLVAMDVVTISTLYPGSSPKEVEKLVTIPVERALKEVDGIDKLHSVSIEGRSTVIAVIFEDLPKREKEKVKTDIQRSIDRIEDLPKEVEKPSVHEIKTHQLSTIEVNLSGLAESELRIHLDILKDKLELIKGVASVIKRGWRDREFWVEVNPHQLKELHLSLSQIVASLQAQNVNLPGGTLKQPSEEFLIRTVGEVETPEKILETVIRSNDLGNANKIKDVATVQDTFAEETKIEKLRGQRALTLIVLKQEKGDTLKIVRAVKKTIEEFKKTAPQGLHLETANDSSYYVKRRLNVLVSNGLFGIILVLIILFLFLSRTIAMITVLGIPFAFFTVLLVMKFFGMTINLISMFGLIIVSGMLVDDGIVFAENIYNYIQKGLSSTEAALKGSAEVFKAVLGSVTTTIIAFLPLAFMSGTMGKFVWQIPAVVIIALLASLLEVFFILPGHCAKWINPQKERLISPSWFLKLRENYMRLLQKALTHKYRVLGVSVIAIIVAIFLGTQVVHFVLFPARGIEIFFIKAKAKLGTPIEDMSQKMGVLENLVAQLPSKELDTFTTQVGSIQRDVNDPFINRGGHLAQITVYLTPESKRKRTADEVIKDLQKEAEPIAGFQEIRFMKVTPGPPIGKPVSVEIRGEEFETLKKLSTLFKEELKKEKGVSEIEDSFESGKKELRIIVDELKASQAGLSTGQIAQTIRTAFEGTTATSIKKTNEEIHVRVRLAKEFRNTRDVFGTLYIPNDRGNLIPLNEVAQIQEGEGISYINHYDYKRTISVTAQVDQKYTTSFKMNRKLQKQFKDIDQKYVGYTVKYGGEQEDSQKSLKSLGKAFGLAFLGILFVMCLIFKSILHPLIILITVPLSLIGVVLALLIHNQPFSFMALIGVIGLSGVVVNNAIILIDFMNEHHKRGDNTHQIILNACAERLRPIILTSLTTIFGLGPLAYGIGGSDPIVAPTALTLSWGLFFSTVLTLFVVPCLYDALQDFVNLIPEKIKNKKELFFD